MRAELVIDASVAVKWVVREDGAELAATLRDAFDAGTTQLLSPDHGLGEIANALRRRVAQGVWTRRDAEEAFQLFTPMSEIFEPVPHLWPHTLSVAFDWELTPYDAVYVLLAQERRTELVSADRRLLDAGRRHHLPVVDLETAVA